MERLAGVRMHPVQYALTTAAFCLFYLAFLSLSEFWPVGRAYAGGAALCTVMITLYTRRALGAARRSLTLVIGLAALYGASSTWCWRRKVKRERRGECGNRG